MGFDGDIDSVPVLAEQFARTAHREQLDKASRPYIEHLRRVAERVRGFGPHALAVAWLHDVIEDCDVTAEDLQKQGFPMAVVDAVQALTKRSGESHEDAVRRACADPIAKVVKAADVADNSDPARLALLDPELAERLSKKYARASALLEQLGAPTMQRPSSPSAIEMYDDAVARAAHEHPDWRPGQAAFNVLRDMRPDLAYRVAGSELDPFHRDAALEEFRQWLSRHW